MGVQDCWCCNVDLLPTGSGLATDGMIKIHHDADWLRLDPTASDPVFARIEWNV